MFSIGLICSPFLLQATLKFHLQQEGTPLALNILNNMYVDNLLIGADTVEEACYSQGYFWKGRNESLGMDFKFWKIKFLTRSREIPGKSTMIKALGIRWERVRDVIWISEFGLYSGVAAKRKVLHCVAKIFDPLGLLSTVTLYGKSFLQKLWKIDQTWDKKIDQTWDKKIDQSWDKKIDQSWDKKIGINHYLKSF